MYYSSIWYYIFSMTNLCDLKYNNDQDKCPVYTCISRGLPITTIFPLRITKLLYNAPGLVSVEYYMLDKV